MALRKKPILRFKGFTDDWEQRKYSNVINLISGQDFEPSQYNENKEGIPYLTGASCIENGHTVAVRWTQTPRCIAEKGDTVLVCKGSGYGTIAVVDQEKAHIARQFMAVKAIDGEIDKAFNYYLLYSVIESIKKDARGLIAGIARDAVLNQPVLIPNIDEQVKIAHSLTNLDNLITLHQRKYEMLKKIKKSFLEKMFPKNGKRVPELRFSGFTDDWEQRKFSEIVQRESNMRLSSSDFPSVEYEDIVSEAGILNKNISAKNAQKKGIIFDGSQILYGKLRPYLHNWLNPDFNGVAVGDWWVLKPIETDKNFIYRLIQTPEFDDVANQSTGSKMPRADWNLVANTTFMIPANINEQKKIGANFKKIDNLITLHQRKLEKLQNLKKALLKKMFI